MQDCNAVLPRVKMDFWFFLSSSEGLEQSSICTQEIAWDKICISFLQSPPRFSFIPLWMTKSKERERERERGNGSYVGDSVDLNLLNLLTGGIASDNNCTLAHKHHNKQQYCEILLLFPTFYSSAPSCLTAPPPRM